MSNLTQKASSPEFKKLIRLLRFSLLVIAVIMWLSSLILSDDIGPLAVFLLLPMLIITIWIAVKHWEEKPSAFRVIGLGVATFIWLYFLILAWIPLLAK